MDAMFILFQVPLINKNGTKSMHCIIRGKFVISPCRKSALFWIHAVILLFHAEILPCGPPLGPHSCAEPFLGVMQKYSFLGDIYTSAQECSRIKVNFNYLELFWFPTEYSYSHLKRIGD